MIYLHTYTFFLRFVFAWAASPRSFVRVVCQEVDLQMFKVVAEKADELIENHRFRQVRAADAATDDDWLVVSIF